MKRLGVIIAALLVLFTSCNPQPGVDRKTNQLLMGLDASLATREMYVARKLDQLEALRRRSRDASDPRHLYDIQMDLAAEFFAFSFDSTQACYKRCQDLALHVLHDKDCYDRASIQLGHLYAKAGSYMEAYNQLFLQLDTASLSSAQRLEYLYTLYDFSMDLAGNSGMVEKPDIPDAASFRPLLLQHLPKDSDRWRIVLKDELMAQGRLSSADSLAHLLLAQARPDEHRYAIYAYYLSDIAHLNGQAFERLEWLVKSAQSDVVNAVRDYASLTMVAQLIMQEDVDRSFRYLRIAQEDAISYNAKLRPWQISRFMMDVEGAYEHRYKQSVLGMKISSILLAVLVLALSITAWSLLARSRKLSRMQAELAESNELLAQANEDLSVLNRKLSHADQVKQDYILDFLTGLSEQVGLLRKEDNHFRDLLKKGKSDQLFKELAISERSEKALEAFYRKFDETFLALYPDFVQQFNELLQEDARVQLQGGERLNTLLRVFALIRLGVDDSRQIAAILHYSVSTIYNYKVSAKNACLGDRDSFEERVKRIGK